jgi:hypothetical protein
MRLEAIVAGRNTEEPLWSDPKRKRQASCKRRQREAPYRAEIIVSPPLCKQHRADDRLKRKNPVPRLGNHPESVAIAEGFHDFAEKEKCKKNDERREISSFLGISANHYQVMNAIDEKKAVEPTPEQLLKLLDMQLAETRQRRQAHEGKRTTFRIMSILILVLGTLGAVAVLMYMMEDLKSTRQGENQAENHAEATPIESR